MPLIITRPLRDVAGLCASLPTLPPRMAAKMAENPRPSWDGGEIRRETDCLLEGTGFEISVPRYPRWSRGSPRSAIRAEETARIGVRFDSLQERGGFAERATDAVEAFERLRSGCKASP